MFGSEPVRVMSLMERDPAFTTDRLSSGILDFGGGRSLFTVGTQTFPYQRVDIIGTGGSIHVHLPFNTYPDVPAKMTVVTGLGERVLTFDSVDQYGFEMDAFSQAVRNGRPAPVPVSDAVGNAVVLDALFRSETSGEWEDVRFE